MKRLVPAVAVLVAASLVAIGAALNSGARIAAFVAWAAVLAARYGMDDD